MKKVIVMAALLILLAGCGNGNKRIDSSTKESFEASIATVRGSLDKKKKEEFENAVQILAFSEVGIFFAVMANPDGVKRKVRDRLDGKTADEIIAEATRVTAKRTELEKKRLAAEKEREKERIAWQKEREKERIARQKERKKERIARQKAELEEKRLAAEKAKLAPRGAFGIKFGDVYTPPSLKNQYNTDKLADGEPIYVIDAPKRFRKFSRLGLFITPKTHKIYGILTAAKLDSKSKAEAEYEIISEILSKKYKMKPERIPFYYEGSGCNFLFKNSGISLYTEDNKALVKVMYANTKLAKLAKKERLEIESKKSDTSAI